MIFIIIDAPRSGRFANVAVPFCRGLNHTHTKPEMPPTRAIGPHWKFIGWSRKAYSSWKC